MCGSKHILAAPINYQTPNSSSKIADLKHTLMQQSTSFSASRLFHRFLMSARSGSRRYHNALPNKIISDCTSYYIDGLLHSVFAESLNLSQVKDSDSQSHNIHYHLAEIYPVLIHWCMLSYYFAEVYATLFFCGAIPSIITLLWYSSP